MTITLSEPSPELAERLMAEVRFEQRLVGIKMSEMGGQNSSPLYSLADVAGFIHIDIGDYETLSQNRAAIVGYIDPLVLAQWVAEVLEDEALASAIRDLTAEGDFYGAVAMPIKELLDERLAQCEEVLAKG